jgi:hypothetical protein
MMKLVPNTNTDRRGRDRMVIGFTTTTIAISSSHHLSCEFESRSWRGVLDKTSEHSSAPDEKIIHVMLRCS